MHVINYTYQECPSSYHSVFQPGINEQRIIVEESKLRSLFKVCKVDGCHSVIDPDNVSIRFTGTVAHATATCNNSHTEF